MELADYVELVRKSLNANKAEAMHTTGGHGTQIVVSFANGARITLLATNFKQAGRCWGCEAVLADEEGPYCPRCDHNNS